MVDAMPHFEALAVGYEAARAAVGHAAHAAHAQIDDDVAALQRDHAGASARSSLSPGVPVDMPPPAVPPSGGGVPGALIPDMPLVDAPVVSSSLAFDDAPLWQS
jgi:hypothetical protein